MKFYNLIAGEKISNSDWFERRNPANTDEVVAEFPKADAKTTNQAIEAASDAFSNWAATPAPTRGDILFRAAELIEQRADALAETMTREEGKTLAESRGEVIRSRDIIRYFAAEGRRMSGETLPSDRKDSMLFTRREPLGVVGIITPWNFPMAIPAWKLAPALVAGCTVVFKPASLVPLMGLRLVEIFHEAGLPKGVLNFVVGSGATVGDAIVTNPKVKGISFTGSHAVGHEIHQKAAPEMTRTQLEMGGKNPLIVLNDGDINLAVNMAISAGFGLTGQACTAASRVIVQRGVLDEFTEKFAAKARAIAVGNGVKGATMGPAVDASQFKTDLDYIEIGKQEGAQLILGGTQVKSDTPGHFIAPTIFSQVRADMRIAQEEIFGPVVSIIPVDTLEEAVNIANGIEYGLSASVITNNLRSAFYFIENIQAGVVKINQGTTGLQVQIPFGGFKKSSTNTFREQGKLAIDFYSRLKSVYLDYPS
ncbi:MAG TPA: aldehyde dehydrogenase family protein [Anaerolineae bacterium]|nr:aldehyde dehydrogenase family protein [Anaerolineae bacterium]